MQQKTKADIFRIFSYFLLIGCFTVAFIYLLVYGQRNAEQIELTRAKLEYSLDQTAILKTSEGSFAVNLNSQSAPISVYSFIVLSMSGFYNQSVFSGGALNYYVEGGKQIIQPRKATSEKVERHLKDTYAESNNEQDLVRGDVLLVNTGELRKEYRFLIVTSDNHALLKNLKGRYPIVGSVISGIEVVERIQKSHDLKKEVTIESIRVL